jgi:signal transduction histidine kinase
MKMLLPVARDSSLRRRLLTGLLVYLALLSAAVVLHGIHVNEQAERLVWQTLLDSEMDHLQERARLEPDIRWQRTDGMSLFDTRERVAVPAALAALEPGIHDEVKVGRGESAVLVRAVPGGRQILALDISAIEEQERAIGISLAVAALATIVLLAMLIIWGVDRLVRPLDRLASQIAALQPQQPGQRLVLPPSATRELAVIGEAVNGYLARNDAFMQRERAFIDAASHELRTPLAVVAGAVDIARQLPNVPEATQQQLQRIRHTVDGMVHLISLLLVLAKDPARVARSSAPVALDRLVPEIVADHRHLLRDKGLVLTIGALVPATVDAPLPLVQVAMGNLLRNAIENSDRGEILIRLDAGATLVIEDPGHGMSPEEISAVYARLARGQATAAAATGIGLELIGRVCEHLGWRLELQSEPGRGTTTTLVLGAVR